MAAEAADSAEASVCGDSGHACWGHPVMTLENLTTLATFGPVWALLSVGHNLADHVVGQTDYQAGSKAAPSADEVADGVSPRRGWGACLGHVAQYHLVMAVMLSLVWAVLPLQMSWTGLAAGLAMSVVTHAFFDRRWPVRWNPGELHLMRDPLLQIPR